MSLKIGRSGENHSPVPHKPLTVKDDWGGWGNVSMEALFNLEVMSEAEFYARIAEINRRLNHRR